MPQMLQQTLRNGAENMGVGRLSELQPLAVAGNPPSCGRQFSVVGCGRAANTPLNHVHIEPSAVQAFSQPTHVALIPSDVLGYGDIIGLDEKGANITKIYQDQPLLPSFRKRRQMRRYRIEVIPMFVLKWRTLAQGFRQLTCTSGISLQVSVHINGHNHGIGWVSYSAQNGQGTHDHKLTVSAQLLGSVQERM